MNSEKAADRQVPPDGGIDPLRVAPLFWAIESELHWVLDIGLHKDESRVRTGHAAANLAVLRRLADSSIRRDTTLKVGAQTRRLASATNQQHREALLAVLNADAA